MEAGLPNIHGYIANPPTSAGGSQELWDSCYADEKFITTSYTGSHMCNQNTAEYWTTFEGLTFDASKYDSIYGSSTTVAPKSRKCRFFIHY